jgi:hypothetical protein
MNPFSDNRCSNQENCYLTIDFVINLPKTTNESCASARIGAPLLAHAAGLPDPIG